jgi:hypothetical protein
MSMVVDEPGSSFLSPLFYSLAGSSRAISTP